MSEHGRWTAVEWTLGELLGSFGFSCSHQLSSPSVSMQSSSSNSSSDARERNWSAKGSCHVSLPQLFLPSYRFSAAHAATSNAGDAHAVAPHKPMLINVTSVSDSILSCQRLIGLLHDTHRCCLNVWPVGSHSKWILSIRCPIILVCFTGSAWKMYFSLCVIISVPFCSRSVVKRPRLSERICIHCQFKGFFFALHVLLAASQQHSALSKKAASSSSLSTSCFALPQAESCAFLIQIIFNFFVSVRE